MAKLPTGTDPKFIGTPPARGATRQELEEELGAKSWEERAVDLLTKCRGGQEHHWVARSFEIVRDSRTAYSPILSVERAELVCFCGVTANIESERICV